MLCLKMPVGRKPKPDHLRKDARLQVTTTPSLRGMIDEAAAYDEMDVGPWLVELARLRRQQQIGGASKLQQPSLDVPAVRPQHIQAVPPAPPEVDVPETFAAEMARLLAPEVGKRLADARGILKMTRAQIAAQLGIEAAELESYERGRELLPESIAITMEAKLKIRTRWLYLGEGMPRDRPT